MNRGNPAPGQAAWLAFSRRRRQELRQLIGEIVVRLRRLTPNSSRRTERALLDRIETLDGNMTHYEIRRRQRRLQGLLLPPIRPGVAAQIFPNAARLQGITLVQIIRLSNQIVRHVAALRETSTALMEQNLVAEIRFLLGLFTQYEGRIRPVDVSADSSDDEDYDSEEEGGAAALATHSDRKNCSTTPREQGVSYVGGSASHPVLNREGVAWFGALTDALLKLQGLKVTVSRGQLRRMEDFDKEMELMRNEKGRRLCLRRHEHWNEFKERFLTVLDYCNGQCTTARFAHAYLRHFGVDLEVKNIPEIVSRLPPRLITISKGREAEDGEIVSFLNGRGKPMHAGRRKIFHMLKKAGGRATVEENMDSHEMTHLTDIATVCWFYFGTEVVEELLPMLCDHRMFVLETERGKELFWKPECRGFFREIAIAAFGSASFPPKITDEDLFSHQSTYVANRIEATLQRLGGDARTRQECFDEIKNHYFNAAFANFVLDCPPRLFQYMIRSKAFMKGELIFLNSERSPAANPEAEKKADEVNGIEEEEEKERSSTW